MVRLTKLYTKSGDKGQTHLVDGSVVSKDSARVCAYGAIDELNSFLGWARTIAEKSGSASAAILRSIQSELFDIGSYLATPEGFDKFPVFKIEQSHIAKLENLIDSATAEVEPLNSFVLPGGSELNSALHICRASCRRVERELVALSAEVKFSPNLLIYINRLSDLLFALARCDSKHSQSPEYLWEPATKRG